MKNSNKYLKESQQIREFAALTADYEYTTHSLKQMRARDVDKFDIKSTLLTCTVIADQTRDAKEGKWKVLGRGFDGRPIVVVVAVRNGEQDIQIISVWPKGKRRK